MAYAPVITFKAGRCDVDTSSQPWKIKPQPEPGYVYLYLEEELVHFCWRQRDNSNLENAELDLVMVPMDGSFMPHDNPAAPSTTTNGRIFVLKFASSPQRYFFWMQSMSQASNEDPAYFSPRDFKIGDLTHRLLQGEEVNPSRELSGLLTGRSTRRDNDDDEDMEDADGQSGHRGRHGSSGGAGGAGPDATGGDVREEGEESREGGADGARAASSSNQDAATAVQNLLNSLSGQPGLSGSRGGGRGGGTGGDKPYPYLSHLLPTSITVPMVDAASEERIDSMLNLLPSSAIVLASDLHDAFDGKGEPDPEIVEAAKESMEVDDKRTLLKKVMRSPQFHQALGTLTMALRDGGLPGVADALNVNVENGGYLQQGGMPLGGGQAVEAFVEGVKKTVQEKKP